VVQLQHEAPARFDDIDESLRRLPGVQDVVVLEDADTAYLKVDRRQFDAMRLADFPFVRPVNKI
jgi:hypothetical protein